MLSLSRKTLLASTIASVVSAQASAELSSNIHLEDILAPQRYEHAESLTGFSNHAITIGQAQDLAVSATIGTIVDQATALTIESLSNNGQVTLNSAISGSYGLRVTGAGSVLLDAGADLQGREYALQSDLQSTIDATMRGGSRIAGNVGAVRTLNIEATANNPATITASILDVQTLNVNTGELLFQQQGTEITGDLNVASNASLQLQINDQTNPSIALVNVRGTATLANGSAINLAMPSSEFLRQETQYTLIRADELVDNGVVVRSLSNLLAVKAPSVEDNERLVATIALAGSGSNAEQELADLDNRLQAQGVNSNGRRAAGTFVAGVLANLDNQHPLYQRYLNANDDQLTQLLEELVPEVNGATLQAALAASGLTGSALSARAAAVGANSGDLLTETGAWVRVLDGDAKQGRRSGVAGYDADSRGLVIGADGKLNEATTLGLALSHVRTDVRSQLGHETDVDSYLLSAYGRWEQGRFGLTGSVSYGLANNDGARRVAGERLTSSYDSYTLSAALEAGYRLDFGALSVEPLLGARYSKVDIDSYREKGSPAALKINDQRLEVFDLGLGLTAAAQWGEFAPSARVMAYHDFAQDKVQSTSSFLLGGSSFVSSGADATAWTYEAGMGLDWSRGQYTLGVAYDYTRKADFHADTLSLKARYEF